MKSAEQSQADRKILIDEQKQIIDELLASLGTVERVAEFVGVSPDSINNWMKRATVAKSLYRKKLLAAHKQLSTEKTTVPDEKRRRHASPRGKLNTTKHEKILKELKLHPPKTRVSFLHKLLDESKLSIYKFALKIKIHENTLKKYLNPEYSSPMNLETARRISEFAEDLKNNGVSADTNKERLEKALLTLLGENIFKEGFYPRDIRRAQAVEKISAHTKLATRTVRRYLPPVDNKKIPDVVVEAFEKAADDLGLIVSDS